MSGTPWIVGSGAILLGTLTAGGYTKYIEDVTKEARIRYKINDLDANAFAHTYASAHLAAMYGSDISKYLGDFKENYGWTIGPGSSAGDLRWDMYKDMYNNEVGRQIAKYLGSDWSRDNIESLILDALKRGDLISSREDSRIQRDFSGKVADFDNSIPVWKGPGGHWTSRQSNPTYKYIPQCFARGTKILMANNVETPIEQLEVGDYVLAFDSSRANGSVVLSKKKVVRKFTNITNVFIDLRGLVCTPGHMFLEYDAEDQSQSTFKSIAGILKGDGCIVDKDGNPCRARTGAFLGALEDMPIHLIFRETGSDVEKIICARAGIPVPRRIFDSSRNAEVTSFCPLINFIAKFGIEINRNGKFLSHDGSIFDVIDWPVGMTPFDYIECQNWIIFDENEKSYTPPWVADLPEMDDRSDMRFSAVHAHREVRNT